MGKVAADLAVGKKIYIYTDNNRFSKKLKKKYRKKYAGKLLQLFIIDSREAGLWHITAISQKAIFDDEKNFSGHGIIIKTIDNNVLTKAELRNLQEKTDDELKLKGYKPKTIRKAIEDVLGKAPKPEKAKAK